MDIERCDAGGCDTRYWTSSTSFESHFRESFGKCIDEIRLPRACCPVDIDKQWSRIFSSKCPAIMIDYTKENAPLVIDQICNVNIRDLLVYGDQPFGTLQMTLPVSGIFDSRIIVVPIKVTIEVASSEPIMLLNELCPFGPRFASSCQSLISLGISSSSSGSSNSSSSSSSSSRSTALL